MATKITTDYSGWQSDKGAVGDNTVLNVLDVATVLSGDPCDSYLNTTTSGIFVADRIYTLIDYPNWTEFDPAQYPGLIISDLASNSLYQVNESAALVPIDVIPSGGQSMFSNSPAFNYPNPPNVRRLITNIANNNVVPIGAFTLGNQFAATSAGVYAINVQSTSLPGRIISLEIFDSLNGISLGNAQSIDVGYSCAVNCIVALIPAQIIQFYVHSTGQGNINIELNVARIG